MMYIGSGTYHYSSAKGLRPGRYYIEETGSMGYKPKWEKIYFVVGGNGSVTWTRVDPLDPEVNPADYKDYFINVTTIVPPSTVLEAKKIVGSSNAPSEWQFEFALYNSTALGIEGTQIGTTKTATNGSSTVAFDKIDYTETGEHFYLIKETSTDANGWKVDSKQYLVRVVVTKNQSGQFAVTRTFQTKVGPNGLWTPANAADGTAYDETTTNIIFNNTYSPEPTSTEFKVTKNVNDAGERWNWLFNFGLYQSSPEGAKGAQIGQLKTATKSAPIVTFDDIDFTTAGTYYYLIEEATVDGSGWTVDKTQYLITVVVEDLSGVLAVISRTVQSRPNANGSWGTGTPYSDSMITFNNTYKALGAWFPALTKSVETGGSAILPNGWEFDFGLYEYSFKTGADGNTVGVVGEQLDEITIRGTSAKLIEGALFKSVLLEEEGEFFFLIKEMNSDRDGWYTDKTEYIVRLVVVDNGKGILEKTCYLWYKNANQDAGGWVIFDGETAIFSFKNIFNPTISVEVNKDTILRTSAAYSSNYQGVPEEGIENVNNGTNENYEQYLYEINFRSTSDVILDSFVVIDPLEAVAAGKIILEEMWTPVVYNDICDIDYNSIKDTSVVAMNDGNYNDGDYNIQGHRAKYKIYYQTNKNSKWMLWAEPFSSGPAEHLVVDLPAGEWITSLKFDFGMVGVGFTSLNGKVDLLNGSYRDKDGNLNLRLIDTAPGVIPAGTASAASVPVAAGSGSLPVFSLFAPMIAYGDTTPVATLNWVNPNLPTSFRGEPATLIVSARVPLTNAPAHDIFGSVNAYGSAFNVAAEDQDAVITRNLGNPDPLLEAPVQRVSYRDGSIVVPISRSSRTGDMMVLEIPIILMVAALAGIILLVATLRRNKRKICAEQGMADGTSVKKAYKKMRMFSLLMVGFIAGAAFVPAPVNAATAPEGRQYYYTIEGGFTQDQFDQWMKELVTRPVDPIPQSVVDQIKPAGPKVKVGVECIFPVVASDLESNDVDQIFQIDFDKLALSAPVKASAGSAEIVDAKGDFYFKDTNRKPVRDPEYGGVEFSKTGVNEEDGKLIIMAADKRPSLYDRYDATVIYQGEEMVWGFSGLTTTIGDFKIIAVVTEYFTAGAGRTGAGGGGGGAGAGAAASPAITIEPEAPPLAAIPDDAVPLAPPVDSDSNAGSVAGTEKDTAKIPPERVPLDNTMSGWSLLSLIFVAIGLAFAVISMLAAAGRREGKASARVIALRILSIVVGVVTLLIWVLIDSFSGYMLLYNSSTLVVGILFVATIVVSAIANAFEKKQEDVDPQAL
jgi:pilin isopeptide linkage protein